MDVTHRLYTCTLAPGDGRARAIWCDLSSCFCGVSEGCGTGVIEGDEVNVKLIQGCGALSPLALRFFPAQQRCFSSLEPTSAPLSLTTLSYCTT